MRSCAICLSEQYPRDFRHSAQRAPSCENEPCHGAVREAEIPLPETGVISWLNHARAAYTGEAERYNFVITALIQEYRETAPLRIAFSIKLN